MAEDFTLARQPDEQTVKLGNKYSYWVRADKMEGHPYFHKDGYWTAEWSRPATPHEILMWEALKDLEFKNAVLTQDAAFGKEKLAELLLEMRALRDQQLEMVDVEVQHEL